MKTHCKHGHEYTPANTVWSADKRRRKCRTCAYTIHKVGARANELERRKETRRRAAKEKRSLIHHCGIERIFFNPMAERGDGVETAKPDSYYEK